MSETLSSKEIQQLLIQGDRAFHQGDLVTAISIFARLSQTVDPNHQQYFNIQRSLVKAYQKNQQTDQAIALCQQMANSNIEAICLWGQNFLATLAPQIHQELLATKSLSESTATTADLPIPSLKPKTLSEFKQYCQENLLGYLQELEKKRQRTLLTIILSGGICLIITWSICQPLFIFLAVDTRLFFYLIFLSISLSLWLIFCRSCIQVYGLGFKRQVIEKIINFIDDQGRLTYASNLFLEDKRRTIVAFTRSQILRDELEEPDALEQEDCIYGNIGDTHIFFAEITVKKVLGGHINELEIEEFLHKSIIFHGLFFEAKFAKNFKSRTFILPNKLKSKITPLNNWRGEIVKLEDPEFNHLFQVYGDSQIEARYLLSTNLINRLVNFSHQAGRKIYLSFVDGFVYIAIPYRCNLFEPKLLQNMKSFAPLKEYFQALQLMIGIVEDLNLNRRIWG